MQKHVVSGTTHLDTELAPFAHEHRTNEMVCNARMKMMYLSLAPRLHADIRRERVRVC